MSDIECRVVQVDRYMHGCVLGEYYLRLQTGQLFHEIRNVSFLEHEFLVIHSNTVESSEPAVIELEDRDLTRLVA